MLNKFRNAFINVVGGSLEPLPLTSGHTFEDVILTPKFAYCRPHFLNFNSEEIQASADHHLRPIITPRDISKLPWNSGYAEAVNAGKSEWNEDQASMTQGVIQHPRNRDKQLLTHGSLSYKLSFETEHESAASSLPYTYFSMFDGHAGTDAAVAAANQLHHILHEKLVDIVDHLLPPIDGSSNSSVENVTTRGVAMWFPEKEVSVDSLIVGALESAFWDMDHLIAEDKRKYKLRGGCTALVALFILGKLYVANAGDSRAVACKNSEPIPMSNDFTPESERQRVRHMAALKPELLGSLFTHLDYNRRPVKSDLGKRILYRDVYMTGWAYKIVTMDDLKIPVVSGEGKRSRVLSTIGVTRGFGDHDLKALNTGVPVKPFLSSQPEVKILDIKNETISDTDVLIMGTDGLWDVTSNEKAVEIVQKSLVHFPADKNRLKYRYTSVAQELVMQSRGKHLDKNWRTSDGRLATIDDISVFIIPLLPYKKEFTAWNDEYEAVREMYENAATTECYGQLLLKPSPVAESKSNVGKPLDLNDSVDVVLQTTLSTEAEETVPPNGILLSFTDSSEAEISAITKETETRQHSFESYFDVAKCDSCLFADINSLQVIDAADEEKLNNLLNGSHEGRLSDEPHFVLKTDSPCTLCHGKNGSYQIFIGNKFTTSENVDLSSVSHLSSIETLRVNSKPMQH